MLEREFGAATSVYATGEPVEETMPPFSMFARVFWLSLSFLLGCQQLYQQGNGIEVNWCYFENDNLVVHRIAPKADNCEEKGGIWVTEGQASILRKRNVKDSAINWTNRASGTGFVVSRQGHVLTNFHVIENCSEVRGNVGKGIESLSVVASDRANDLAVLKSNSFVGNFARFREDQGMRAGDSVVVVGYPLSGVLTSLANVTTGSVTALAGMRDDVRFYQISAPVQPGNSGGPVLDQSGNVVGVVVSKLDAAAVFMITGDIPQNVNYAIKGSVARNFLHTHGVRYVTASSSHDLKPADIGERANKYTIALECWR